MFGTVVCNKEGLEKEELQRYQSVYCGLCHALKDRFGNMERFSQNYDMTFLALLLSALYEPGEEQQQFRCSIHPLKNRKLVKNAYIEYAADMTVLLSYYKCLDDWEDEKKVSALLYGKRLQRDFDRIKTQYPRQSNAIRSGIEQLNCLEHDSQSGLDDFLKSAGLLLSEVYVYQEDFWGNSLRYMGYEMGSFVYLMDAVLDYKQDRKRDLFNPLLKCQKLPQEMEPCLKLLIGNVTGEFEKLPIVQDEHLLKNILYGGVWQKYENRKKMAQKETKK